MKPWNMLTIKHENEKKSWRNPAFQILSNFEN